MTSGPAIRKSGPPPGEGSKLVAGERARAAAAAAPATPRGRRWSASFARWRFSTRRG